ncbi:ATP-binding protein [Virgibacillus oceani]|uniref:ORC1/DEAH AAA+ ATPase domain-containing protein n=1 Tax=Virgibacillus oceani TaxID=1479511 RepID=A0A917HFS8_9BACI|nr:ATP-binding protein [Virgibacillus oceani]GGG77581.1 hypothetical protein GCM10011398_23370 [Virgibacillus oceani]
MQNSSEKKLHTVRPNIPVGGHPIEQGDYLIDTIAINEIADSILKWISFRNPGAIIYGAPRLGKSYAIKYLKRVFDIKYENQWITFVVRTRKMKTPNESRFFEFLLKDVGHELFDKGKADAKRERLVNFFLEKGDGSVRNQVVLFVDDAQRLSSIEFEWLMDIFNELDSYGITLTTILVGQKELSHKRNIYLTTDKQIVGRFMIQENKFYGLREKEELAYLLASYDQISEYPVNSGWSYTRYFFPIGYEQGYRLENETDEIWQSFQMVRSEAGIKRSAEIPMHYMIAIINYVLKKYGANEENVEWPTTSMWREAMIESGYVNAEVIQSSSE